jgi:cytochrome d ubiquinol oxidase subunit II
VNTLAVVLLSFFLIGYFILGGADIGVGMLLPFLGRRDPERRLVIAAIAPFFLGNEVWLVATVGLLAGAFPALEASVVHGLYPAVAPLLIGWVVRDMGLWLRGRIDARGWRAICDALITLASWALALSWGIVLTALISGSTDQVRTDPGALLAALAIGVLFGVHGLAFSSIRLTGAMRVRAGRLAGAATEGPLFAVTSAALVALVLLAGFQIKPSGFTADQSSLTFLLPPVIAIAPVLVLVQAGIWWLFRHRVTKPTYL